MNLIWSIEHNAWWRAGWAGYTRDPLAAGLFDEAETEKILRSANAFKTNEAAVPEQMVFYAPSVDWEKARCQETTGMIGDHYTRCNRPAVVVVKHLGRNEDPYAMCELCASHNVGNRGAVVLREKEK